ncbi:glycosyltransferase [Acetobacterium wieringae]|uniref:glycosyltransferase n=1 Tax=Acetobacterium wieringae TaxID=52694 RepID=UPI002B1F57B2|nr:glycosyltransferase [Acetobacterium wieringae]MEA4807013.1 glycosyltransferase [Acetobacterium wieringae]
MIETFEIWIIIGILLLIADLVIIVRLIRGRGESEKSFLFAENQKDELLNLAAGNPVTVNKRLEIANYCQVSQSVRYDQQLKENITSFINMDSFEKKSLRGLKSRNMTKKAEAALYLGVLSTEKARLALEDALTKEKNSTLKLYIANGLADIGNPESLTVLTNSLLSESRFYRNKVNMLITDFGEDFHNFLPEIIDSQRIEFQELIVDFSVVYFSETLKNYLIRLIATRKETIAYLDSLYGKAHGQHCVNCGHSRPLPNDTQMQCRFEGNVEPDFSCRRYELLPVSVNSGAAHYQLVIKASGILAEYYPRVLDQDRYLYSDDLEIRNAAMQALANFRSPEKMDKLLFFLRQEETARGAINSISTMIEKNRIYFNQVVTVFLTETDLRVKKDLATILSLRIEYFIMKLTRKNSDDAKEIITEIIRLGRTSEAIDFLNKNKDINVENELIAIIKEVITQSPDREDDFARYLNERLAKKCGFTKNADSNVSEQPKRDEKLTRRLLVLLLGSCLIVPIIYCIRHWSILFVMPLTEQLELFVMDFNYYIAFYAMAVNLVYLILLVFSYISVVRQERLWKIKDMSLLFKKRMLPSISIIAPAYNEEKTIIESANSLLNLKYPEYELIIVNDGSKDQTLNTLINYYDLKRVDYLYDSRLSTKAVRGIYLNRSRPQLIVVDKLNGGKADSLNVGINIANKEYVCGIDADSLLEDDALIKLASLTLDEETETPALGGNILPINGCTIDHGQIAQKGLAESKLARFQTIEYIRSFMSGRLGWSYFNCLLIISGAFGLFRKERIIDVGGYLTSSGRYKTDTVGEDMELVVRISRQMKESKRHFRILYAYNANCWTEVPEDLKTLKKQRYRWHRGLIEILTYHRKMMFNPSYGRIGTVAIPYFYIFEMLGPLFEIQGYLMIVLSALLGILNVQIAIILFVSMVLMGILVSISSLLISEKNGQNFSRKELWILVFYATIENFGVRQYFSLWRFGGYLNMFRKPVGWQKADRKGFASKVDEVTS